ncbi:glycosyltransferase [Clostridium sp. C2-6-12]|uniref:glycosyltransferase n=1 Tax=Clostridium sp. C2-6-12 TaxID=2698832 RepID=UPI00136A660C|nr:glycosyltransferase [Clostridium sp. C2-6-12]
MKENKIAFIICVLDEGQIIKCNSCINDLEVPLGIDIEMINIKVNKSIAEAYNIGMNQTDAKYKVYLHSNTYITNKKIIRDLLDIFQSSNKIGLIGVVGTKRLPESGLWWNDPGKVGEVNILNNGKKQYYKLNNIMEKYEIVEAVDGLIMATQIDIKWREDIFDGLYFYDMASCMEFNKRGFEVIVPRQEETWCIHDWGNEIDNNLSNDTEKYRQVFLKEYPIIVTRSSSRNDDLFNFNRNEAMNLLVQNRKVLENHFYEMKNSFEARDYEGVANKAYEFAAKASWSIYHPDFYQSPEIENMLIECASKIPTENYGINSQKEEKRKVLHVLSEGYSTGGHTRLAKNWIKSDTDSIHSLVATWQLRSTPGWLINEVKNSGGWVTSLETVSDKFCERAKALRKLAYEWADVVVLHMHMMDPIPVMAFGVEGGPPVIYMNHGDHLFWLGASIADLVADLRPSGQELTLTRRSCKNSCILPIPLEPKKFYNKKEIREKYNIDENELVILTIASNYKFRSINNHNYIEIVKNIVNKIDNCKVYIIGPNDIGKWHEVNVETGGKIKALGVVTEIDEFYQLADIYLDCFMMGSMTSLLDGSKYGLSIIKFTNNHCPILTEFDEEFKECSYKNVEGIIEEIKLIKEGNIETLNKHKKINASIEKNHILDTKEKIKDMYNRLSTHKVNKNLIISNRTEDNDLFWIYLIGRGYVF